jgi:hypothetical protein
MVRTSLQCNFPKSIGKWDLDLESQFNSPNFTINYFGTGNESANNDEILEWITIVFV